MTVDSALVGVSLPAVDTSPWIYLIERHPGHIDVMRAIIGAIDTGRLHAVSSVITLVEVLTQPLKVNDPAMELAYRNLLLNSRNFAVCDVDIATGIRAAELRAKYQLRTPDAVQVATALTAGCDAFLTNDLKLRRISELRILVLSDLTV